MLKNKLLILSGSIFLGLGILLGYRLFEDYREARQRQVLLEKRKAAWDNLKKEIEGRIADFRGNIGIVIKDLNEGWEIDFNKGALFPSASLVKVPILLSYFYAQQEGKVRTSDLVSLKSYEKVPGSKVLGDSSVGSIFSVEELFEPMIAKSDNTATNILIDLLGFEAFNDYFIRLGLRNTNLVRRMMDFEERKEGRENYTTAEDMAYLLEILYRRSFLDKNTSEKCLGFLKQQKIKDRIPRKLPEGVTVAHKTGLENYICHDAGIVFTQKGDFLICVLTKHQDKFAAPAKRFISDIALITYNYYQSF